MNFKNYLTEGKTYTEITKEEIQGIFDKLKVVSSNDESFKKPTLEDITKVEKEEEGKEYKVYTKKFWYELEIE